MFPDVTTAVAADVRHDRIDRAGSGHRALAARTSRPAVPGAPRPHHGLGGRVRRWLAAGYL